MRRNGLQLQNRSSPENSRAIERRGQYARQGFNAAILKLKGVIVVSSRDPGPAMKGAQDFS